MNMVKIMSSLVSRNEYGEPQHSDRVTHTHTHTHIDIHATVILYKNYKILHHEFTTPLDPHERDNGT